MKLYHVTHSSNRYSIERYGLLVRHPSGYSNAVATKHPLGPGVYGFRNISDISRVHSPRDTYDVWEFEVDDSLLTCDTLMKHSECYMTSDGILPHKVRLVEGPERPVPGWGINHSEIDSPLSTVA